MTQPQAMVEIRNVCKSFGDLQVLRGIDLTVEKGKIVSIIGPSGSGKSTLLRSINHLETIDSGEIWLDGIQVNKPELKGSQFERHINEVRQKMGMVFQQFNLFPHLTTIENVMLAPLKLKRMKRPEVHALAMALLTKVGLESKADVFPSKLSGGQKQRVAIARALAMQPKVMLFDEVTSALDPELVDEVNLVMRQLAKEHTTMLIVTHEMSFAKDISDWVVFMDGGYVVEEGPPDAVFVNPKQERTQNFLRKILGGN